MNWSESLGMDKPKQRRRSRCVVTPRPIDGKLLHRRPTSAVCWDGVVGRDKHDYDRDGICVFCSHVRAWEPL